MDVKQLINPKGALDGADALARRIPDGIARILRNTAVALGIVALIGAIILGWMYGWRMAKPVGVRKFENTKSLFSEDIQRDYNRSRVDIQPMDSIQTENNLDDMDTQMDPTRLSRSKSEAPMQEGLDLEKSPADLREQKGPGVFIPTEPRNPDFDAPIREPVPGISETPKKDKESPVLTPKEFSKEPKILE